jgi:hypothetical protein
MANELGKLRRSAVISTFAPGAIVDFRAEGAAISGVVAGLEEWDTSFPPAGLRNPQQIGEPRLQQKLGVRGFRLPPVTDPDADPPFNGFGLVARRFPEWLQCPKCDRIGPVRLWADDPGKAPRYCGPCTAKAPGRRKVYVVPVRFVMACEAGHLDEFPFHMWVHHKPDCSNKAGWLLLRSERPGLAGLYVSCPTCKQRRDFEGVFSKRTWKEYKCRGLRPWLPVAPDPDCTGHSPRAVQRGASNLYFPVTASALSIPAWSDGLQDALGVYWQEIVDTLPEDRAPFVRLLARNALRDVLIEFRLTADELTREVERRVAAISAPDIKDLRGGEYRQFTLAEGYSRPEDREFETRVVPVPDALEPYFERIVRVVRLREVRALTGFTRILPSGGEDDPLLASISIAPADRREWLPAIDVRGEGIFLELSSARLNSWFPDDPPAGGYSAAQTEIRARAARVDRAADAEWVSRGRDPRKRPPVTARFLLIHTFAHALMRQLTLDCGYSSAALRERLYVRNDSSGNMAGLLVYTASSDADGTLGGLQRQGEATRLVPAVVAAVRAMEWCSSDPLCMEGVLAGAERLSNAVCHACALAPETACEEFNRYLDRALVVGVPEAPDVGYFSPLLRN